jgi:hypothetical protein
MYAALEKTHALLKRQITVLELLDDLLKLRELFLKATGVPGWLRGPRRARLAGVKLAGLGWEARH